MSEDKRPEDKKAVVWAVTLLVIGCTYLTGMIMVDTSTGRAVITVVAMALYMGMGVEYYYNRDR